ncbi:FAD-dependent oxidoreductase, partial [bacterium]|nr:FAD-dependent oxidoreductase [bacterium]
MTKYDIAVIGGGPAGITLAKMLGKKKKIVIIRPEPHSMIYCAMPYAIGGVIENKKTLKKDGLVTDAGAELLRNTVTNVDFKKKKLTFSDDSKIRYEKLVIATGATPFIPPIPGNDLAGATGFKTEEDLNKIDTLVRAGLKKAVVVGAGAIGIELALALNSKNVTVDLVDMGESVLPHLVDLDMAEELTAEIIRAGINLHLNSKVTTLIGKTNVEQVILDNGHIIHFDPADTCSDEEGQKINSSLVVFATGMRPTTAFVHNTDLKIGKDGIIINNKMETNIPDVYAVGDCTQFTSGIMGEVISGKLATNAVPMAKVLGFNLLGQQRTYPGFYNGAATKAGKYFVGATGLPEKMAQKAGFEVVCGYSEVTTQFPIMPNAKKMSLKLIADRKTLRLLGAQIVSEEPVADRTDLLTFAIQLEKTIDTLTRLSYSAQPYQSFYPAANGIVLAAEDILKKVAAN